MDNDLPSALLIELTERHPEGSALLSEIGNVWRSLDPTFSPQRYGKTRLSEVLELFPHRGRLDRKRGQTRWHWTPADGQATRPDRSQGIFGSNEANWCVRTEVWAPVLVDPQSYVLDLDNLTFVRKNAPEVDEVPERFLGLPTLPEELVHSERPASDEQLNKCITDWLISHQIPLETLMRAKGVSSKPAAEAAVESAGARQEYLLPGGQTAVSEREVRLWIHQTVDQMTVDELLEIRIPARLVVRKK